MLPYISLRSKSPIAQNLTPQPPSKRDANGNLYTHKTCLWYLKRFSVVAVVGAVDSGDKGARGDAVPIPGRCIRVYTLALVELL
jgi:hypothetical protein